MDIKELTNLTNAELNIKLKTIENEYEAEKKNAAIVIEKMQKLDREYALVKNELKKRNQILWKQEI